MDQPCLDAENQHNSFVPSHDNTLPHSAASLENAPNDIHYMILEYLYVISLSSLFDVAQASKTLRRAARPFIYKNLVLDRGSEFSKKEKRYRAIIERFYNDAEFPLAQYVRNITIKNGVSEAVLLSVLTKISECGILHKLWYCNSRLHHKSFT